MEVIDGRQNWQISKIIFLQELVFSMSAFMKLLIRFDTLRCEIHVETKNQSLKMH